MISNEESLALTQNSSVLEATWSCTPSTLFSLQHLDFQSKCSHHLRRDLHDADRTLLDRNHHSWTQDIGVSSIFQSLRFPMEISRRPAYDRRLRGSERRF